MEECHLATIPGGSSVPPSAVRASSSLAASSAPPAFVAPPPTWPAASFAWILQRRATETVPLAIDRLTCRTKKHLDQGSVGSWPKAEGDRGEEYPFCEDCRPAGEGEKRA